MSARHFRRVATWAMAIGLSLPITIHAQQLQAPTSVEQFINADRGLSLAQLVAAAMNGAVEPHRFQRAVVVSLKTLESTRAS